MIISSGLEWDALLENELWQNLDYLDSIELIPENFFYAEKIQLKDSINHLKKSNKPLYFHGVQLSIGSSEPLKELHLENIMKLMDILEPKIYSEHLSMTEANNIEIGQLTPLLWCNDLADQISEKIIKIQNKIKTPFLIENISNRFIFKYTQTSETDFINRIIKNTNCGLLLDITNVFTNSINHDFEALDWLNSINLAAVSQIHLAGGTYDQDHVLEDSHDNAVWNESWQLYEYVIEKIGPRPTIIERTGNIPQFKLLLDEVAKARSIQQNFYNKFKLAHGR